MAMPSRRRAVPISCAQAATTSASLGDILAHDRRARQRAVAGDFVGRALRRATEQDRIVAMIDRLDVHDGLVADIAAVIAHPLAERPFRLDVTGLDEALDDDLRIGRN